MHQFIGDLGREGGRWLAADNLFQGLPALSWPIQQVIDPCSDMVLGPQKRIIQNKNYCNGEFCWPQQNCEES
jgi:hypothetical protein